MQPKPSFIVVEGGSDVTIYKTIEEIEAKLEPIDVKMVYM